jgi:uncharacterized membrane protein YgcG
MRKLLTIFISICLWFGIASSIHAQTDSSYEYLLPRFRSRIEIQKDTSIVVHEEIKAYFPYPKHGIYRIIPYRYTVKGKTFQTRTYIQSITDESGQVYPYTESRSNGNVQIKIGDPDKTITGDHIYRIDYRVESVVQRYEDHDELYWNVTGHGWDTEISSSEAFVSSPFAKITQIDCFAGEFGTEAKNCLPQTIDDTADFAATKPLAPNDDFTIVVGLSKDNQLVFPSNIDRAISFLRDNWAVSFSVLPLIFFGFFWWKKGRDLKYVGDNVYYKPDNASVVARPLFFREHLPMVYSPIQDLSPSEIGTLVDQKVDVNDVVAEITELARLKYIKIERIVRKKLIGEDVDYVFIKLKEDSLALKDYQTYLFESIFTNSFSEKSIPKLAKILKDNKTDLQRYTKLALDNKLVTMSAMQTNFYPKLESFKKKLYKEMAEREYFDGDPNTVRGQWVAGFIVVSGVCFWLLYTYANTFRNLYPLFIWGILEIPTFLFAYSMPRRKPWGYSLYRQIEGLAYYLKVGKWREEIAEKELFFAEMLPIAISLRIVDKLAKEMDALGIAPPTYMNGFVGSSFARDFTHFETVANKSVVGGTSQSHGSWSGGSGFSGGSSGGGFGGGGGGSW